MSKSKASADPFKRHRSARYKGVSFRILKDGSRRYAYYHAGSWVNVDGGEKDAVAAQAEARGKAARGESVVTPSKATFGGVAEAYMDEKKDRLRPGTWKTYQATLNRVLIPRFGRMKIAGITVRHIRGLIRDLEKQGLSSTTIRAYVMPLRGVLGYAVEEECIFSNPCDKLRRGDWPQHERRKEHQWSDEDIEALIDASEQIARRPESRYDYSPLIRVAAYTGLRPGELLGLKWQDIDLHEDVLRVEGQWRRSGDYGDPKTKAGTRRVPLSPTIVSFLREHKERAFAIGHAKADSPVFASKGGTPLSHRNVTRRGFEPAAKLAGLKVSIKGLRHAYGSKLVAKGVPLAKVAEVMGHESAATTLRIYTHVYDAEASDAVVRAAMA